MPYGPDDPWPYPFDQFIVREVPDYDEIMYAAQEEMVEFVDDCEVQSMKFCPVDTTRLMRTIRWEKDGDGYQILAGGIIGFDGVFVHYAGIVHDGHGYHTGNPRPFVDQGIAAALRNLQERQARDRAQARQSLRRLRRHHRETLGVSIRTYTRDTDPERSGSELLRVYSRQEFRQRTQIPTAQRPAQGGASYRDPVTGRFASESQINQIYGRQEAEEFGFHGLGDEYLEDYD